MLYLALVALLGLGVAALVRDSAAAIGVVLSLLYLSPIFVHLITNQHWHNRVERYSPMQAGLTIPATRNLRGLPISPWGGLGVLAAWAAVALLTGGLALRLRDACAGRGVGYAIRRPVIETGRIRIQNGRSTALAQGLRRRPLSRSISASS